MAIHTQQFMLSLCVSSPLTHRQSDGSQLLTWTDSAAKRWPRRIKNFYPSLYFLFLWQVSYEYILCMCTSMVTYRNEKCILQTLCIFSAGQYTSTYHWKFSMGCLMCTSFYLCGNLKKKVQRNDPCTFQALHTGIQKMFFYKTWQKNAIHNMAPPQLL